MKQVEVIKTFIDSWEDSTKERAWKDRCVEVGNVGEPIDDNKLAEYIISKGDSKYEPIYEDEVIECFIEEYFKDSDSEGYIWDMLEDGKYGINFNIVTDDWDVIAETIKKVLSEMY